LDSLELSRLPARPTEGHPQVAAASAETQLKKLNAEDAEIFAEGAEAVSLRLTPWCVPGVFYHVREPPNRQSLGLTIFAPCGRFHACSLNPASLLKPDAGEPNSSKETRGRGERRGQPAPRPLQRPSPSANLAGVWKGNLLKSLNRGIQDSPIGSARFDGTEFIVKDRPERPAPAFAESFPPTPHGLPVQWVRVAGVLVLLSLIVQHGFPFGREAYWLRWLDVLLALVFTADLLLAAGKARKWRTVFEARRVEFFLVAFFSLLLILGWLLPPAARRDLLDFLHLESAGALAFNLVQLFLLLSLCLQLLRGTQRLFGRGVRPELILAGSFATLIVIGTLLLLLPNSSGRPETHIGVIDAFFTATSATCVTGLVVLDTGTDFSTFGQMVILVLFQLGGLGIITFVAFLSVFSRRAPSVPQLVAFRHIVNAPALSDLKRQIIGILLATAFIELAGVMFIYHFLPAEGDALGRLRWSIFHSVSAFCNAGFALQTDSLMPFQANTGLMFTFMVLIILGGLGFLVIVELVNFPLTRSRRFRRLGFFRRLHTGEAPARLSVQSKLSLTVTLLLLAGGFLGFAMLEFNHLLRDRPLWDRLLISAFQSVTTRTAGFNTVAIHELKDATLILMMMLMVVGASPVSMGGGIKTVSFGILLLALRAMITRRERVEAFGRTLPAKALFAALSVFVLYVLTAGVGIFLLTVFDPQMKFQDQVFEVISALSTVGLSTGITADLSAPGKLVICLLMFVGRIGPISLVLSVFQSRRIVTYEYPEEEVVVG
jgi:trk system potassium uptake protein